MRKLLTICFVGTMLVVLSLAGCQDLSSGNDETVKLKVGSGVVNSRITTLYKRLVQVSRAVDGDAPNGYEWKDIERTILNATFPDGTILDVYEDEEQLEDAPTYMILSEYKTAKVDERTTGRFPVKTYGYNFCFYEIVNFEDNTTYKLDDGTIVRTYPSLNMWIYSEDFIQYYGAAVTKAEFTELLKKFGCNINSPDESWWGAAGWATYDAKAESWICHQVGSMRFYAGRTYENLSDYGISIEMSNNGTELYVYDKIEEPIVGKKYKWLNQHKETVPETSDDGAYAFYLFEEDNGIVSDYPSLLMIMKSLDNDNFDIHYGDSKVWNGLDGVTVGFNQSWTHDGNWGWGTYNNELGVYVHHRIHTYRYDEIE